jgi:hypothetical protein
MKTTKEQRERVFMAIHKLPVEYREDACAVLRDADALEQAEAELAKHEAELLRMEKCVRVAKRALTTIFTAGTDPDPPEVDPCESCVFPYVQKEGER